MTTLQAPMVTPGKWEVVQPANSTAAFVVAREAVIKNNRGPDYCVTPGLEEGYDEAHEHHRIPDVVMMGASKQLAEALYDVVRGGFCMNYPASHCKCAHCRSVAALKSAGYKDIT